MRISRFGRYALSSCAVAAVLAGCGGSQPPVGAPGAMPQTSAIAARAERGKSWMLPEASGDDLIYAVGCHPLTCVFSYPDGKLVGTLSTVGDAICSDSQGNVFIPDGNTVTEYAHGGTYPIATLNLPGSESAGCAVDTITNNLAVINGGSGWNIAIFTNENGTPTLFDAPVFGWSCGYDGTGNLFVDGATDSGYGLAELPSGSSTFTSLSIDQSVGTPGQVQWDGKYITYEDREWGDVKISQLSISGSAATIVGTTKLRLHSSAAASWIFGNRVIVPHPARLHNRVLNHLISYFKYPQGGAPLKTIKNISGFKKLDLNFSGVTISVAPSR